MADQQPAQSSSSSNNDPIAESLAHEPKDLLRHAIEAKAHEDVGLRILPTEQEKHNYFNKQHPSEVSKKKHSIESQQVTKKSDADFE